MTSIYDYDADVAHGVVCPECGADDVGTLEKGLGISHIGGFSDKWHPVHLGETEWFEEEQHTIKDEGGRYILACGECGARWANGLDPYHPAEAVPGPLPIVRAITREEWQLLREAVDALGRDRAEWRMSDMVLRRLEETWG